MGGPARLLSLYLLLLATTCRVSQAYLTIAWIDTTSDTFKRAKCQPEEEISVTTPVDYIKLYSVAESKQPITAPCYCQLYAAHDPKALKFADVSISAYAIDRFETLQQLHGTTSWGNTDVTNALKFETSAGDMANMTLSYLETSLSLESTLYIVISNVTVYLRCRTDPYPVVTLPPPKVPDTNQGTEIINVTVVSDKTMVADNWYKDKRLLAISCVVVGTLLLAGIGLCVCIVIRKRRKNIKELSVEVDERAWRTPGLVTEQSKSTKTPGSSSSVTAPLTDTEGEDSIQLTVLSDTPSVSKPNTLSRTTLSDVHKEGGLEPQNEPKFPVTRLSNDTPDVVQRGIYDNVKKPPESSYVHAQEGSSTADKTAPSNAIENQDLHEVPEYAEIEEMQMLLKKPDAKKTDTNTSNTTNTSDSSMRDVNSTPKAKRWKFRLPKTKKDNTSSVKYADMKNNKTPADSTENLCLQNLDFSQLKEAIDKMDPDQVTAKIQSLNSTPSLPKKNMSKAEEPIYSNELPQPPSGTNSQASSNLCPKNGKAQTSSKVPGVERYDSPSKVFTNNIGDKRNTDKVLSPQTPHLHVDLTKAGAPQRSTWDAPPSGLAYKTDGPAEPSSPRSKWGSPVVQLYAQPEKPSRLPRPTSPTKIVTPSFDIKKDRPVSSYHVPKSSSTPAFQSPSIKSAYAKFDSQTPPGGHEYKRPSVLSSRSFNVPLSSSSQSAARKTSYPIRSNSNMSPTSPNSIQSRAKPAPLHGSSRFAFGVPPSRTQPLNNNDTKASQSYPVFNKRF